MAAPGMNQQQHLPGHPQAYPGLPVRAQELSHATAHPGAPLPPGPSYTPAVPPSPRGASTSSPNVDSSCPWTPKTPPVVQARKRSAFSREQLHALHLRFQVQRYLTPPQMAQVGTSIGLTQKQVKTWFQNKRMKFKRQQRASCPMQVASQQWASADMSTRFSHGDHVRPDGYHFPVHSEGANIPVCSYENGYAGSVNGNGVRTQWGADSHQHQSNGNGVHAEWGAGTHPQQSNGNGVPAQWGAGTHQHQSYGKGVPAQWKDDTHQHQSYGNGIHAQWGSGTHQHQSYGKGAPAQWGSGTHQHQSYGKGVPAQWGSGTHPHQSYAGLQRPPHRTLPVEGQGKHTWQSGVSQQYMDMFQNYSDAEYAEGGGSGGSAGSLYSSYACEADETNKEPLR